MVLRTHLSGTHRWADTTIKQDKGVKQLLVSLFSPKPKTRQTTLRAEVQIQQAKTQNPENKEQRSKHKHSIQPDKPNWQQGKGRPGLYTQEGRTTMRHRWDTLGKLPQVGKEQREEVKTETVYSLLQQNNERGKKYNVNQNLPRKDENGQVTIPKEWLIYWVTPWWSCVPFISERCIFAFLFLLMKIRNLIGGTIRQSRYN